MSASSDWAALDHALDRALDLEGSVREAFLASLDEATREALAPLLRDALREDSFLDRPHAVLASLYEGEDRVGAGRVAGGTRLGPYQIEALVGEGGMGRVFRAHRVDGAFDQTVAIKVVRAGLTLAGSDVSARLRRERDVLASLDHPGIARLLDGGETDDGVPYLVTEFIDGEPLPIWADARALDVKGRVRLMVEVARAIDHAHRRFIVHRDLKPSNVLVTERSGRARPVVLDFGIAKLLDDAEREGTQGFPLTSTGLCLLTPAYAAPELFVPEATVTTSADVFGLGALLYELLTGRRPREGMAAAASPAKEVTRPSKVVVQPRPGTAEGAAFDPARRARALRGDLDTICLKALHPDPARRYASAAALADDLTRYLDARPVEARPDSLAYVAGRFARRHRAMVAAALVALLALVGGLGVALVALADERAAHARAEAAAARAEEAADLLAGLFRMSDPDYDDGRAATLLEAVAEGGRQAHAVTSDPLRAYLLLVLGQTYIDLGEPSIADSLLQAALLIHGEEAVSDEATRIRLSLAVTRDALADPERTLALAQQVYRDHRGDADPGVALSALGIMSRAYGRLGRHDEAVEAAERARALVGPERGDELRMRTDARLGESLSGAGRIAEAIPYLEQTLRRSIAVHGRASGETSRALAMLGHARGQMGEIEEAEALLGEAIAFHAARYGANRIGYPLAFLGEARLRAGRFQAAAAALDSAVTMTGPIIGRDHPDLGHWLTLQATAHNGYGAYEEAEQAARRALTIVQTPGWGEALGQLARALRGQGRDEEALALGAASDAPQPGARQP